MRRFGRSLAALSILLGMILAFAPAPAQAPEEAPKADEEKLEIPPLRLRVLVDVQVDGPCIGKWATVGRELRKDLAKIEGLELVDEPENAPGLFVLYYVIRVRQSEDGEKVLVRLDSSIWQVIRPGMLGLLTTYTGEAELERSKAFVILGQEVRKRFALQVREAAVLWATQYLAYKEKSEGRLDS